MLQKNPVHIIIYYLSKIRFNIIPRLCLVLPSGLVPSGFITKILETFLIYPMRATCPANDENDDDIIIIKIKYPLRMSTGPYRSGEEVYVKLYEFVTSALHESKKK
jgi:hypothetical protein